MNKEQAFNVEIKTQLLGGAKTTKSGQIMRVPDDAKFLIDNSGSPINIQMTQTLLNADQEGNLAINEGETAVDRVSELRNA